MYLSIEDEMSKTYLSICTNMKLSFYIEAILLTCRWSKEYKPEQICMYESHDNF